MIGMLVKKQADFAISPLAVTYLRSQAIDFANPLYVDYGRILGRRGDTEVNPWSFVLTLTASAWLATAVTLVVMVAFVATLSEIQWRDLSCSPRVRVSTYLRAFLQQDITVSTENTWEKLLLGIWLLGVFIIVECYSTNLTSLFAVRYITEPYQSLKDVVSDSRVTSIWFQNTAYIQYLSSVKSGVFYEVAETGKQGRIKQIEPQDYAKIVNDLVSRGDHVMINPLLMMKMFLTEDYMENGNCKFYVSREMFLPFTFCMTLRKYSPLRETINQGIRAVVEGGLYDYWLDKSFANAKSCKNPPTVITVMSQLSLANTWGIFLVLLAGYGISISALLLELAAFSISKARSSRNLMKN
ncbi:glutamate receptor 3-like [Palaemon carinicauda]|uniref:glutamate receptor 3-like n=1 Tax=Palaemon carinicauda TaxID=392227 RepID=UPI0035B61E40